MAVTITKPASAAEVKGTATVQATYSGQRFDIATCTLGGKQLGSDSAQPISFSVDTTKVADGTRTLTVAVRYKTAAGKLRWQKASISVKVKNVAVPPPPSGWVRIAQESQAFTLTANKEVRYGAGTSYYSKILGPGTYRCDNAFFGDPLVGGVKYCESRDPGAPPPPPSNVSMSAPTGKVAV